MCVLVAREHGLDTKLSRNQLWKRKLVPLRTRIPQEKHNYWTRETEDPWLSRSRYSPLMGSLESIHMTGPITPRYLLWKRASQWPHSTIQAMTSGSPTWFTWFNPRKDLEIAKKDWRTAYPLTSCPQNSFLLPSFWSMLVSSKLQAILPYK